MDNLKTDIFLAQSSFSFLSVNAQTKFEYGVKAGLNYNSIDDLTIFGGLAGFSQRVKSESDLGFHFGVFSQINFTKLYLRTELIYVQNKSRYNENFTSTSKLKLSTLELPVLAGFKIIKPLSFYAGPSLIYNIDGNFSDFLDLELDKRISLGINIGSAFEINKFRIDLRYTKGIAENIAINFDAQIQDGLGYSVDTKPNQFLLSLTYRIN